MAELRSALGAPRGPLTLAPPTLEPSQWPLQPAVLPPALPRMPPPPLELFDLDETADDRHVRFWYYSECTDVSRQGLQTLMCCSMQQTTYALLNEHQCLSH